MSNMASKRNVGHMASGYQSVERSQSCQALRYDAMFGIKKLTYFHVGNGLLVSMYLYPGMEYNIQCQNECKSI